MYNLIVKLIIIFIIINLIFFYGYIFINNNNIKQLSPIDKIILTIKCGINYKLGLAFVRKWDITYLKQFYKNDPLMINFYYKLKNKYGNIAIVDTYIKKLYIILDADLSKKILNLNENKIQFSIFKKIFFLKIMKNNLALTKGKERNEKRLINENLFGTNKNCPLLNNIKLIIKNNLKILPKNHNDFDNIALKIISEIITGNLNNKINKNNLLELKKTFNYIEKDTDLSFFGFFNKLTNHNNVNIYCNTVLKNYNYKSLIYSFLKECEKNNINTDILKDEISHWIIPMYSILSFMIPILLHMILSSKELYDKILQDIDSPNFYIENKRSYLHYIVIEHLRLFNIINIHTIRNTVEDINIDNFKLKKNSEILILFSSILRNPSQFYLPNKFYPERWDKKSIEEQNIVFGVGQQRCPSINFTPMIYKLYIFLSLKQYKPNFTKNYNLNNLPHFINAFKLKFNLL